MKYVTDPGHHSLAVFFVANIAFMQTKPTPLRCSHCSLNLGEIASRSGRKIVYTNDLLLKL